MLGPVLQAGERPRPKPRDDDGHRDHHLRPEWLPHVKAALIATVDQGIITADLKGKTYHPDKETIVDMYGFLDAIEKNLKAS